MFRKQLDPKTIALVTCLALGVVLYAYWRGLVYQEPMTMRPGGGGGGPPAAPLTVAGREDVSVETLTGGDPGYRDGAAWKAQFFGPNALALGPDGSLYITDSRNHRIRRVSSGGTVSTVAGGGQPGGPGGRAEGPAAQALFRFPSGVALAPDGAVLVSDTGNHRICRLKDGVVTVLAGGTEGRQNGQGASARFRYPAALTLHGGALWVVDTGNKAVRKVTVDGAVSTPGSVPVPVSERFGELVRSPGQAVLQASANGSGLFQPTAFKTGRLVSVAADSSLRVAADSEFGSLLAWETGGPPLLVAGRRVEGGAVVESADGAGNRAAFALPCSVVLSGGTAYVADYEGHRIRKVTLPDWLRESTAPPVEEDRRNWGDRDRRNRDRGGPNGEWRRNRGR